MKKTILRTAPATFLFFMLCCGKGISSNFKEADYTKYKAEQNKKVELNFRKK